MLQTPGTKISERIRSRVLRLGFGPILCNTCQKEAPDDLSSRDSFVYLDRCFCLREFDEYQDAGRSFYATDFWSLWEIGIRVAYIISSE